MKLRSIGVCARRTGAFAGLVAAALAGIGAGAGVGVGAVAQDIPPPEVIYLFADLGGAAETAGGDKDGYGDLAAALKLTEGQFCYELSVGNIAAATAAHIHEGKAGTDGPPVITISVTGTKNETCVETDTKLLDRIADRPGDYYVNVHNSAHPSGAIRGQLQK
ncbi:CHRD domain-containing protein [Allopontixanthobacter sp.]|uniref:CHRD domain-containing protein n=1 Tax=Allopontixanthobacter sp. TaxID=2906452 RepID=UPI002ABCF642|nr:CHRD domain-containing protein [Allopontixanthobacter sp.]MDZ4306279.1 CHRD domain-containing protein [Allopontixanthobacter sp.]